MKERNERQIKRLRVDYEDLQGTGIERKRKERQIVSPLHVNVCHPASVSLLNPNCN